MGEQITILFYLTRDLREAFLLLSLFRSSFKYVVNLALFFAVVLKSRKKVFKNENPFIFCLLAASRQDRSRQFFCQRLHPSRTNYSMSQNFLFANEMATKIIKRTVYMSEWICWIWWLALIQDRFIRVLKTIKLLYQTAIIPHTKKSFPPCFATTTEQMKNASTFRNMLIKNSFPLFC